MQKNKSVETFKKISDAAREMGQLQEQLATINYLLSSVSFPEHSKIIIQFDPDDKDMRYSMHYQLYWKTLLEIHPSSSHNILQFVKIMLKDQINTQQDTLDNLMNGSEK